MSAASGSRAAPMPKKYTAAMPLMIPASSTLSAFARCRASGRKMPIAASIRIPMPAPK